MYNFDKNKSQIKQQWYFEPICPGEWPGKIIYNMQPTILQNNDFKTASRCQLLGYEISLVGSLE